MILLKPVTPGSHKGPQISIKNHGSGKEIYVPVIEAILRRFEIDRDEFWGEKNCKEASSEQDEDQNIST